MPDQQFTPVVFAYNSQNNDGEDTPNPHVAEGKDTPTISYEMVIADMLGRKFAAACAEFCQNYSTYCSAKNYYADKSKLPVTPPPLNNFLEPMDYIGLIQAFSISAKDAQAYKNAWKSGHDLSSELRASLGLCEIKIKNAATAICNYYDTLSPSTKEYADKYVGYQYELILRLAGRVLPQQQEVKLNAYESQLTALGIDFADAPDHYFCPITTSLMTRPMNVSANGVTHIYDRSVIHQIMAENGSKALCPFFSRLFSELTVSENKELKEDIDNWVKSKMPKEESAPSKKNRLI